MGHSAICPRSSTRSRRVNSRVGHASIVRRTFDDCLFAKRALTAAAAVETHILCQAYKAACDKLMGRAPFILRVLRRTELTWGRPSYRARRNSAAASSSSGVGSVAFSAQADGLSEDGWSRHIYWRARPNWVNCPLMKPAAPEVSLSWCPDRLVS